MQDIFYKNDHLSLKEKKNVLIAAKKKSTKWWVDILDCRKSWRRQKIKMSFDDVLLKLKNNSHFVIIHRTGIHRIEGEYLEIGFCTFGEEEYFLWIICSKDEIPYFVEKYNLKG